MVLRVQMDTCRHVDSIDPVGRVAHVDCILPMVPHSEDDRRHRMAERTRLLLPLELAQEDKLVLDLEMAVAFQGHPEVELVADSKVHPVRRMDPDRYVGTPRKEI